MRPDHPACPSNSQRTRPSAVPHFVGDRVAEDGKAVDVDRVLPVH